MGNKKVVYSDIHWGHPYEKKEINHREILIDKDAVFLGDNWDIGDAPLKQLERLNSEREETIKKVREIGGIYVSGNHSLVPLIYPRGDIRIDNRVLYTHGDIIDYTLEGATKRREEKTPGRNPLSWNMLKIARAIYPGGGKQMIGEKYLRRAQVLAKENNCHTICLGHFHPRTLIDIKDNGVRTIVVPRGITKIEL